MRIPLFVVMAILALAPRIGFASEFVSCGTVQLGQPLKGLLRVIAPFDMTGKSGRAHKGTDYAARGADVIAVADGSVTKVGWDMRTIPQPDSRTALLARGWGRYVVVRHSDGAETLYAHMEKDITAALAVGASVKRGQVIGKSDSTGAVTGPHLHVEYAPGGNVIRTSLKMDPDKCIWRDGSVTMFSATKIQGGAFRLSLDGKEIGRVAIGEKATFQVTGLLPGRIYKLRLEALEAQLGSEANYGAELSDGLTFLNDRDEAAGGGRYAELRKGSSVELLFAVASRY